MAETAPVLVPVTEFAPADLSLRMVELVSRNQGLLAARFILGPLGRYADPETARASLVKARNLHNAGIQQIYVPVGIEGDPQGMATIYPGLPLRKLHLPIPRGLPDHRAARWVRKHVRFADRLAGYEWWANFRHASHNLTAWTAADQEELLAQSYAELDARLDQSDTNTVLRPWTIEPLRSPGHVHEAIARTSLQKVAARRRFDDNESLRQLPPQSILYARLHSEWWTAHGRQRELQTGETSWTSDVNEKMAAKQRQVMTRPPKPILDKPR